MAKEVKKVAAKPATKPAPVAKKAANPAPKAAPAAKVEEKKVRKDIERYHLSKSSEDGMWRLKLATSDKVIRKFSTKEEAVKYAKMLTDNNDRGLAVHASKGKNKGRITKV